MTGQEQIAAIDALVTLVYPSEMSNLSKETTIGYMRDATINRLKRMYELNILHGCDIYTRLLQKHWTDATPEEAAICENATQAMREALEAERNEITDLCFDWG